MLNKGILMIEILCHRCKGNTEKSLQYLTRRIRDGKLKMYCSRKCANAAHSELMTGAGNPNFDGKFHGQCPSEWSEEKRAEASRKTSETFLREGTVKGDKNPRWAGGFTEYICFVCGKDAPKRPYIHRKIVAGEQKPFCSIPCVASYGRSFVKREATSIEVAMQAELERRGIEFDAQYDFNGKFKPDFILHEYKIIIECDGDYWHRLPEVVSRDKRKNAYYKACGYSTHRFWESEINADVEACVDVVLAEINELIAII